MDLDPTGADTGSACTSSTRGGAALSRNGLGREAAPEGLERVGDPVSSAEIAAFVARLAVASPAVGDAERVERIGLLEGLKAAAAGGGSMTGQWVSA